MQASILCTCKEYQDSVIMHQDDRVRVSNRMYLEACMERCGGLMYQVYDTSLSACVRCNNCNSVGMFNVYYQF